MRKVTLSLVFALAVLASATAAHAKIFVNISDGTSTLNAESSATVPFLQGAGLRLSQASLAPSGTTDVTVVMNVLSCSVRPCTVFFPSGTVASSPTATPPAGSTFKLQDVSSTSLARIEKFDSGASADRVSFKGVKITSLVAGRNLTIKYGVQAGDLRTLSSTSTSYTGTAVLTGTFKTATGLRATACNAGLTSTEVADSCVKLSVALNGTTVNGAGSTAVATVSVPCNNSFPTVNPCGTGGLYSGQVGSFTGVNDVKSISCASICKPTQVGTVIGEFKGANEVLQLTASANGGMANVPDEQGGLEEVFLTLADELGANRWVAYTAASERCRAVFKAPSTNDTRNVTNKSTLPISSEFWCGFFAPPPAGTGIDLLSIVDEKESVLAGTALTRNDASRVAFLPGQGQLQLKDITVLSFTYDVVVESNLPSGNSALGNVDYTDCTAGSLKVELQVLDNQGNAAGTAKVYLGSNPGDHFQSACDGFESIGLDLVNNADARVDTSGLVGNLASPCCITFQQLQQGATGNLRVRKVSLVVDHGSPDPDEPANHKVTFFTGQVNSFTTASALQVVTGVTRTFDLSTNGVSIVITKLTSPSVGESFVPAVVKVIRSENIVISGGKFTTSVNVNEIQPESGAEYTIALCPSGAETDSGAQTDPLVPPGLCIGDQAFMTLL